MRKVYWIQLKKLVVTLCRYMQAHNAQLPDTLKGDAATALAAVSVFCDILIEYDATHIRGEGA
jgi:hypothetical protein